MQTFFISINVQIILFRRIILKPVDAKKTEGGPISNWRPESHPGMQLETRIVLAKKEGCFAKEEFETKR